MSVPYDTFTSYFLDKIKEYDFIKLDEYGRTKIVDDYMKRACAQFNRLCKYDIITGDDAVREFDAVIPPEEMDEIADIVSEGMVVQWLKPYVYRQENYENILNTTDFSSYSPAELLNRIASVYKECKRDFTNMMKEYSYNHGDLTELHL